MQIHHNTGTIPRLAGKINIGVSGIASYIILTIIFFIVFIPIFIVLFASFKTVGQIGNDFALKLPTLNPLYLENYRVVFIKGKIFMGFKNSILLVITSVAVNIILGSATAYVISRFEFKLKKIIIGLFLLGMIIPAYTTEIARFPVINHLGLYNTMLAPIVIYAATDLMQLYIYRQFMDKIPVSLDESAMMDGCTYYGIFLRIIFPLLLPATATLSIIKAVDVINDMYIPYLYMPSPELRTLTTTLMAFSSSKFSSWEYLSAAIIVVMLPTVIIYLFFQKYIFAGIVAGAVKE